MRRAGLVPTDRRRKSPVPRSHANAHVVYLAPAFAPVTGPEHVGAIATRVLADIAEGR
jgi:hypothetical protein